MANHIFEHEKIVNFITKKQSGIKWSEKKTKKIRVKRIFEMQTEIENSTLINWYNGMQMCHIEWMQTFAT